MARSSGDTLGLGELGYASGTTANVTTQTSLGAISGGTSTVSINDYGIDRIDGITIADTTPAYDSANAVEMEFTAVGNKFIASIGAQTRNFNWRVTAANSGTFTSPDYIARYTAPSPQAGTLSTTIQGVFNDSFNDHAAQYNTALDQAITIGG